MLPEIHRLDCTCRDCRRLFEPALRRRPRGFLRTWAALIGGCLAAWASLIAIAARALSSFTTR